MKDNDTPLLALCVFLGCCVAGVAVKLAFWPVRRPYQEPASNIRLQDYSLSNFGGENNISDSQIRAMILIDLNRADRADPSDSTTGELIQLPTATAPVESNDLCR